MIHYLDLVKSIEKQLSESGIQSVNEFIFIAGVGDSIITTSNIISDIDVVEFLEETTIKVKESMQNRINDNLN